MRGYARYAIYTATPHTRRAWAESAGEASKLARRLARLHATTVRVYDYHTSRHVYTAHAHAHTP